MTTIDPEKRRRVMRRSQHLGHCICDPRRGCPCDVFTGQGLCPCAGERPAPRDAATVRLTELVHHAGCASKIAPRDLDGVLSRLPAVTDPAVISGIPAGDDAGIYRLADDLYLVQTVDVMTPCVDDPYTFGMICAANCLSDIYAMGGTPRTALSILAFPSESLDGQIMYQMMRGAMELLAEAGVALIGGHSIKDEEIKLGFAITGVVTNAHLLERGTARVGDRLVLTKPLGTGVLGFARQIGRAAAGWDEAVAAMMTLNSAAAEAAHATGVSACTDVTGFGLFGHLRGMVTHAGVTARVHADRLPAFPGTLALLRDGVVPGAIERNAEYVGDTLSVTGPVDEATLLLGYDAQTSGGLLFAVPADRHDALLRALDARGVAGVTIGEMTAHSSGRIELMANQDAHAPAHAGCCADATDTSVTTDTARAFAAFQRAANAGGAIDARAKALITLALVILNRCAPCLDAQLHKARALGISDAEIEEAMWCAVAIGGAPVRAFYQEATSARADGCC